MHPLSKTLQLLLIVAAIFTITAFVLVGMEYQRDPELEAPMESFHNWWEETWINHIDVRR